MRGGVAGEGYVFAMRVLTCFEHAGLLVRDLFAREAVGIQKLWC